MNQAGDDLLFEGLEPSSDARRRSRPWTWRRVGLGLARRAAFWSPVVLPLALLAQNVLGGLGLSREESRRLEQAETVLTQRLAEAEDRHAEYALRLRAYRDPVYLERERRLNAAREAAGN